MSTENETYTLLSLLDGQVNLDSQTLVPVDAIVIPRIQRPYAQGRTDEHSTFVRQTFLDELFESIESGKACDLNFIYGVVTPKGQSYALELLDGQQRITTLFLLYWYIVCAELREAPEKAESVRRLLHKFAYETRTTASLFCNKLVEFDYHFEKGDKPSDAIKNVKWYFKSFDRDSTVCAMLNTLDDIHERYIKSGRRDLFDGLKNISFYVKSLGQFNLSEELYIKMNARGLQLSPFENFKADLINFITKSDYPGFNERVSLFRSGTNEEVTFDFNFSVKLDAKWVDLFWRKDSDEFDDSMMSFFTRFFSCKYIADTVNEVSEKDMRGDRTIAALYTNAENNLGSEKYLGFKTFEAVLSKHPENIIVLDKVLDVLYDYDLSDGRIYRKMLPEWEKAKGQSGDDFYRNSSVKITHVRMIALGATIAFIEHTGAFNLSDYDKWMRVVWNIIENTNIDGLQPMSSLIRKFDTIATWIGRCKIQEGIDFYPALARYRKSDGAEKENRAVIEEVEKARRIAENKEWEQLFEKAENHPFFKGMVTFFYNPEMTTEDFRHAYENALLMFDAQGISEEFRQKHLLIRAIVSCLSTWEEINQQYITERAEPQKYLKNLLASNENVRRVITEAVSEPNKEQMFISLEQSIKDAPKPTAWIGASAEQQWGLQRGLNLLRRNHRIYDWMERKEKENRKVFRVYWYNGSRHILLAQPRMQFDKIALDTERALMVKGVVSDFGFGFCDLWQKDTLNETGEIAGNEIWLSKESESSCIWVGFLGDHKIEIQLRMSTIAKAKTLASRLMTELADSLSVSIHPDDSKIVVFTGLEHWMYDRDYPKLSEILNKFDDDSLSEFMK
ncbi:MAG: DUF262 domain-containing protein [Duncaniella sp.]|nr:DUF262 domain-containing protein [Duncaniella sp.]